MKPKSLGFFSARVEDGSVVLAAYKASRFYKGADSAGEFERIRIYRRRTDFSFGVDYEEYCHGITLCDSDTLIFEGPLPAGNKRKFTFVDPDVVVGETYLYFMRSSSDAIPPVGPVMVKVRDPGIWWPNAPVRTERLPAPRGQGTMIVAEVKKPSVSPRIVPTLAE